MTFVNGTYIAGVLANQLDRIKEQVMKKDRDKHFLIDGREGCGKSVFAMQLAKALDNNFNIDKIAFNAEDFIKLVKDTKRIKGDCILLDEAFSSASARASLSQINRAMITVATEMRQLNLYVIIVLPSFFDLDRYFAIWRCDTLFHVYFNEKGDRGQYIIFPFEEKLKLYIHGKKIYNYQAWSSPYPPCDFPNTWIVNEKEYRERKAKAFRNRRVTLLGKRWKDRSCRLMMWLYEKENYKFTEIAEICGMKPENTMETLEKWQKFGPRSQNILDTNVIDEEDEEEEDKEEKT